ncbi:MAG: hypothetical protein JSV09_13605 [Thermoplasmata archaeon]|nr:MAG: hypothetical protein JSV09_13605 [Thermoplasmata archaeon]
MINDKELLERKKRVDFLSREARRTHEALQGLCNEIIFVQGFVSVEKAAPEINNLSEILMHQLSKKVMEHLTNTRSLLMAYEEYSGMLERAISAPELRDKEHNIPDTLPVNLKNR